MTNTVKFHSLGIGLEPQSADPTSPTEGQLQYSDGTARTEGLWRFNGTIWVELSSSTNDEESTTIKNLGLATSVSASALTISLKGADGNDPSGTNSVDISFRDTTLSTGEFTTNSTTSALSTVISSGSKGGSISGIENHIYVYAIDNAGSTELAWSMSYFNEGKLHSTTAEGGAGAADSNSILYSTTARSGIAVRLISKLVSSQPSSGTWSVNMSAIQLAPVDIVPVQGYYTTNASASTTSGTYFQFEDRVSDSHNCYDQTTERMTCPEDGIYTFISAIRSNTNRTLFYGIREDGVSTLTSAGSNLATNNEPAITTITVAMDKGAQIGVQNGSGGAAVVTHPTTQFNYFTWVKIGELI